MKRKVISAILLMAMMTAICAASGCNKSSGSSSAANTNNTAAATSEAAAGNSGNDESGVSAPDKVNSETDESKDISEEIIEKSDTSDPDEESSKAESDESSENDESDESIEEKSEAEESSEEESSEIGYQFDDEQMVTDYHTATVFTSDDEFNKVFENNSLDKEYKAELEGASSNSEMMTITAKYSGQWKNLTEKIYSSLRRKLEENPTEQQKLIDSQDEWSNGLAAVENSFYNETRDSGTEGLLAAETAIMNYYKGRSAVLLQQIYEFTGSIDLSDYTL